MAATTRRLRTVAVVAMLGVAVALVWGVWTAVLRVGAAEGSIPPRWRGPDLPPGATVVSEDEPCASGGCWRETVLSPAPGQTPEELVDVLGLAEPDRAGWHVLDPHPVEVSASVLRGEVRVVVRYRSTS